MDYLISFAEEKRRTGKVSWPMIKKDKKKYDIWI